MIQASARSRSLRSLTSVVFVCTCDDEDGRAVQEAWTILAARGPIADLLCATVPRRLVTRLATFSRFPIVALQILLSENV